jgi:hypothetical protein
MFRLPAALCRLPAVEGRPLPAALCRLFDAVCRPLAFVGRELLESPLAHALYAAAALILATAYLPSAVHTIVWLIFGE